MRAGLRDLIAPLGVARERFRDVVVYPTQALLGSGITFQGGPDWPHFRLQLRARQCQGVIPVPTDRRPDVSDRVVAAADEPALWCGPIMDHFGHMIADFGMRIAASGHIETEWPLAFSAFEDSTFQPMPAFWEMLDHLRIDRARVRLVRRPTRFARLDVLPQAERLKGGWPSRAHLAFMDALVGRRAGGGPRLPHVFLSRSRFTAATRHATGRIAGESYLDQALATAGVHVAYPEEMSLAEQLSLISRARNLLVSEGSAVHAMQLLGHVDVRLAVLNRRPRARLAFGSLWPRVPSLRYVDAVQMLVHGLKRSGMPFRSGAAAILDSRRLARQLRAIGFPTGAGWRSDEYRERRDADLNAWARQLIGMDLHGGNAARIAAQLRAAGVEVAPDLPS